MAEVTRVPLQPVAPGSLTKIWLGVIVAVLIGAGLAWAAVPKSFSVDTIVEGEGRLAEDGDAIFLRYVGKLAATGEEFDRSQDVPLPIQGIFPEGTMLPLEEGNFIEGFYEALKQVQAGGEYEVFIPAEMAYGASSPPGSTIPANADLIFEIEVTGIMNEEEFNAKLDEMQSAMASSLGPQQPEAPAQPQPPESDPGSQVVPIR